METPRRAYTILLLLNTGVIVLASLTAMLLPAPAGWPDWVPMAWSLSAIALSGFVLLWWVSLHRRAQDDDREQRVAALSLASLPLLWSVFAIMAFWSDFPGYGLAFLALALVFAVLGYALQPDS